MARYITCIKHDGASYQVEVDDLRAPRCAACGEIVITTDVDEQLRAALRAKIGLLTPDQIRENRVGLGKTQKELAAHLGAAEATVSRWETGGLIQSRAMDRLLRVYFAFPEVRVSLAGRVDDLGRRLDGDSRNPFGDREDGSLLMRAVRDSLANGRQQTQLELLREACAAGTVQENLYLFRLPAPGSEAKRREEGSRWICLSGANRGTRSPSAKQMSRWLNTIERVPRERRSRFITKLDELVRALRDPEEQPEGDRRS